MPPEKESLESQSASEFPIDETSTTEAAAAAVSSSSASAALPRLSSRDGILQWSASAAAAAAASPVGRGGFLSRLRRPPPPPPPRRPRRPTDHWRRRPAHWSVAAAADFPASAEQRIHGGQSILRCDRGRRDGSEAGGGVEPIWHFLIRLLRG